MSPRGISTIGRSGIAALLALAFVALCLPAGASAADGSISGEVTRAAGGAAVVGVDVCAEDPIEEVKVECDLTDATGSYEIAGLSPGGYVVGFRPGGTGLNLLRQYYEAADTWEEADEVTVLSGATTGEIDAALVEGGSMAGRVIASSDGLPLAEVLVCSWWEVSEEFGECAETGADGRFRIDGLHPGSQEVEIWPAEPGYERRVVHGVTVSPGGTTNLEAALVRSEGSISGQVHAAATGQPLGGVSVCIIDEFDESRGCAETDRSGAYEFVYVPRGEWRIAFSPDPSEFEAFEAGEIKLDAWPTQFWNEKPTLALANVIEMPRDGLFTGIDGSLGPGPDPVPPFRSVTLPLEEHPHVPVPPPLALQPKVATPLHCGKGKVKKRVKSRMRCVRRPHHPKHHRRHHHH